MSQRYKAMILYIFGVTNVIVLASPLGDLNWVLFAACFYGLGMMDGWYRGYMAARHQPYRIAIVLLFPCVLLLGVLAKYLLKPLVEFNLSGVLISALGLVVGDILVFSVLVFSWKLWERIESVFAKRASGQ